MKFEQVDISGFRGLANVELVDLDSRLNVFVGINGAGKSSILEALKFLLQRFQAVAMGKRAKVGWCDDDVRIGMNRSSIFARATVNGVKFFLSVHHGDLSQHVPPSDELMRGVAPADISVRNRIANWRKEWKQVPPPSQSILPESYPVLVHYPVTRAVLDISERTKKPMEFGEWSAWDDSLTPFAADFGTFFTWFRQQEDLENEKRLEQSAYQDQQLQAVRDAVERMLPGYTQLRIRRTSPVRMTLKKSGQELALQQFSDGEKCLVAMVGDLARRLSLANPGSSTPLEGSGVVLIDELDLHLHPQWQIDVIPRLLATFPRCQFFVTTHSPLLVSYVHPQQLYLLTNEDGNVVLQRPSQNTYGQDMNMLVSTFMGAPVRETATDELLKAIFAKLSDSKDWRQAAPLIERVRVRNSDLPDIVKAQAIFDRKELLTR
ncbi:MAG: AAA family ATPase [Fibrobacteres bacterium]|jgi:predicted ATP-binding protein involved in virulence|nr:AAA family ATPase [Fibrobacterota bacterium]